MNNSQNKKSQLSNNTLYFIALSMMLVVYMAVLQILIDNRREEHEKILTNQAKIMEKLNVLESEISKLPHQPAQVEQCQCGDGYSWGGF